VVPTQHRSPHSPVRQRGRDTPTGRGVATRIIKAEAELEASEKLSAASAQMAGNPAALEPRRMQIVSEVGAENNR
jgi:hypothetical protein